MNGTSKRPIKKSIERSVAFALGLLLFAMASIQAGAALAKDLFPVVGALGMTAYRLGFASLVLLLWHRPWGKRLPRFTRAEWRNVAVYGASLGIMNLTFYLALARIPLGLAVALEFTGPLAVALSGSRRASDLAWAAAAAAGMALLLPEAFRAELDPVGVVLALTAGSAWAFYIVYGKRAGGADASGASVTTIGMVVAAIVVGISVTALNALPFPVDVADTHFWAPTVIPLAFGVALFSSVIPYSLEMVALRKLPTRTFGVLMSLEPALAATAGFIFLGERLKPHHLAALALIMIASFGSARAASHEKEPNPAIS